MRAAFKEAILRNFLIVLSNAILCRNPSWPNFALRRYVFYS